MSDWYFDSKGIFRCVKCDAPFAPGHTAKHHPSSTLDHRPLKLRKAEGERLEAGMALIHGCEQDNPLDLGRFLR